jgi:adenylate cyclase class 2
MCSEIEAKLKVGSLKQIEQKLQNLGAEFHDNLLQTDIYFDDENKNLTKADTCLRIRRQTNSTQEKVFLTYKGSKENENYKQRREIEFQVPDAVAVVKLLTALGYKKGLIVDKQRQLWHLGHCEVLLDDLPQLGTFVEIEGPDADQIKRVQKDLELDHLTHIHESYASLIEKKLAKEGN